MITARTLKGSMLAASDCSHQMVLGQAVAVAGDVP